MADFSSQKEIIETCKKPTRALEECVETLKMLREENDKFNPYISLGRAFELYKQGAKEEHADWYFFKYLESLGKTTQYIFSIGETKIEVPIDTLMPYVEIKDSDNEERIINPQWHLMISYYAYIDATYNHDDNEYAKKIKKMPGYPSDRFGIRCKSLKKWMEEGFMKI